MKRAAKECAAALFFGLGFVFLISPVLLYLFIHGSYERYMWIIQGPFPFSHLGGGPFQILVYSSLFIVGIISIVISTLLRKL